MAEATKTQDASPRAPGSGRGISYPYLSLSEAITRAQLFWNAERKNSAPIGAAVKHWGYGEKSSGGKRIAAALIQYGLMVDDGNESNRKLRLTDRALHILLDEPDSPGRWKAIREAALAPKIYAELLNRWPANELPSDHTIQFYLVKDRGFNPNTVADFLKAFHATVSFAKLSDSDNIAQDNADVIVNKADENEVTLVEVKAQPANTVAVPAVSRNAQLGHKQDVFSLDEGQVVLQWPEKMSTASYEDFKAWLELQVRKIARSVKDD